MDEHRHALGIAALDDLQPATVRELEHGVERIRLTTPGGYALAFCTNTPLPYLHGTMNHTSVPRQLATFAAVLAVLFAAGALAGQLIDPDARGEGDHGAEPAHGEPEVHGLAVADRGLRLDVVNPELRRGRPGTVAFRIVGADSDAITDFDVTHEKRMHLILVRRDLTGFQHLHPEMAADGTWSTRVTLPEAGSYRLFADFSHDGDATTLATDLRVDGAADLRALPAPQPTAVSDGGYDVRLDSGGVTAGEETELRFAITRDGEPVDTEPYLGAGGHLVALREGDLAFLHVHPKDDGVAFGATFPSAGRYRLFLQFQHEGRVQTVAFTQEVSR